MQITDNYSGTVYTFPIGTSLQWNIQVEVTPMLIPLQSVPLLLNFGGASPTIVVNFTITPTNNSTGTAAGDWQLLTSVFASGSTTKGYTLSLPEVGMTVQGFTFQLQLNYAGGTNNVYNGTLTFYPGTIIG